uniref:Uncharacterized protein n=1 Tax=Arundo donax TaxID=35708 RepID=A0A0A8YKK7_ARUDO
MGEKEYKVTIKHAAKIDLVGRGNCHRTLSKPLILLSGNAQLLGRASMHSFTFPLHGTTYFFMYIALNIIFYLN